jgi:REP element-mobilizing transposase RayT
MHDGDFSSTRRRLPHWRLDGATYFITFRLLDGEFCAEEIAVVRDHVIAGDGKFYDLIAVMVMPDHVHAALTPKTGYDLARITKGIKGVSARLLNERRGTHGAVWQDESWDRIVRDHDELLRELRYMYENPLRAPAWSMICRSGPVGGTAPTEVTGGAGILACLGWRYAVIQKPLARESIPAYRSR